MPFLKLLFLIAISYLPLRIALARPLAPYGPVERVAFSLFGSIILFFIAGMASFFTGVPALWVNLFVPSMLLLHGVASARRGRGGWPIDAAELRSLAVLTLASAWILLAQLSVVNYGGGDWYGDWYEHYERALFFFGGLPLDHRFLDVSPLAARPPLFNVATCYLMSFIGAGFSDYQVIATFLGCLIFLPAGALLARLLRPASAPTQATSELALPLACLILALNPMAATNLIYPWTRMLSSAFLLMGLYLYLRVVIDGADSQLPMCAGLLVASHLTHYSADVVALPLALHLLYRASRSLPGARRPALAAGIVTLVLGGLWHGWSLAAYGLGGAASVTTWQSVQGRSMGSLSSQILTNLGRTLWPFIARIEPRDVRQMDPSLTWHALYDRLHPYWVSSLAGAISTTALLVLALTTIVALASGARPVLVRPSRELRTIVGIMAAALAIGFFAVPWVEPAGIAHLSLQPICILALLLVLMVVVGMPRWAAGCFSILYSAEALFFYFLKTLERITPTPSSFSALYSESYYRNLRLKLVDHQLVFLSDLYPVLREGSRYVILSLIPVLGCLLWWLMSRVSRGVRA